MHELSYAHTTEYLKAWSCRKQNYLSFTISFSWILRFLKEWQRCKDATLKKSFKLNSSFNINHISNLKAVLDCCCKHLPPGISTDEHLHLDKKLSLVMTYREFQVFFNNSSNSQCFSVVKKVLRRCERGLSAGTTTDAGFRAVRGVGPGIWTLEMV